MKNSKRDILIFGGLLIVCALFAHGQGVFVPQQTALKSINGLTTPIANATITVCAANAGGIPCSPALVNIIFKDAALTQPLSNPFTSDSQGNYQFAVAPGTYTVTVTSLGFNGNSYQVTAGSGGSGTGVGGVQLSSLTKQSIISNLTSAGLNVQNVDCSFLSGSGLTDAGCGAIWQAFILQSIGQTQNNMRHSFNVYFESDLHQTGGGNEFYGQAINSTAILDAGSTGSPTQRFLSFEPIMTILDPANSGAVLGNGDTVKLRTIIGANAHVTNVAGLLFYLPTFTSAFVTNYWGILYDSPIGTPTTSTMMGGGGNYQYGVAIGATVAPFVAEDSSANISGFCHGTGTPTTAIHDCYLAGNGSPEGAVTAKVGSIFARQDGAAGTALYVKGTGTGNTGWNAAAVVIGSGTASMPTGLLTTNTCATAVTVASTNVLATDSIKWSYNAAPGSPDGLLTITAYVTAGNVNFLQCNPTSASQTPVAATINWEVIR